MREWLIALGILVVGAILLDGVRRMRAARRDSLRMTQQMNTYVDRDSLLDEFGNEFPSGAARVKVKEDALQQIPVTDRIEPSFDNGSDASDLFPETIAPADSATFDNTASHSSNASAAVHVPSSPVFDSATQPLSKGESDVLSDARVIVRDDFVPPKKEQVKYKESKPVIVAEKERRERELREREENARFEAAQASLGNTMKISGSQVAAKPSAKPSTKLQDPEEVVVIRVMARDPAGFAGVALLDVLLARGMRYGHHNIFHYYTGEESAADSVYSLANVVNPGTFNLEAMDGFTTPGVSLFLPLPAPTPSLAAFESMLETAQTIASTLNGELRDELRSAMTSQTIEHNRQRIIEFEMKKRLNSR